MDDALALIASALLLCGCNAGNGSHSSEGGRSLNVGQPAPALVAEGWLNSALPSDSDLAGKVLVIDVWAYWCGPCANAAPELVELYEQYKSQDVVFLGLTSEGSDAISKSQTFLDRLEIPWPNGYGASQTINALEVEYLPTVLVIDPQGIITWRSEAGGSISEAIDRALAKS